MENVEELCDSLVMLRNGQVVLKGTVRQVRQEFGRTRIFVTTDWTKEQLEQLPHVIKVETQEEKRFVLRLDDETAGKEIFDELTHGQYIEEFNQQPPTLNEIFRLKAGAQNE